MELFKEIFMDWLLFSLIEGIIYVLTINRYYKNIEVRICNIIIFSIITSCFSLLLMPLVYQICIIISFVMYCKFIDRDIKFYKISLLIIIIMISMLIIETVFHILYQNIFNINFIYMNRIQLFISMIPVRSIEFIIIKRLGALK